MTGRQDQALTDAKSALELSNRVPEKALDLANSALSFSADGDWETQAYAYAALGSSYASLGRCEEAIRHVNEAQKSAFELRLTYVLARIHQARGWVAYIQDNSVLAFSDWQVAYGYFQQIRDTRGTAWILMHYAQNYAALGLIDHSIRCQMSALDLMSKVSDADTYFKLKVSLARSYVTKAWSRYFGKDKGFSVFDAQIATSILLDVLQERVEDFSPKLVEEAFQSLGEALLIQRRPKEAIPNLNIAFNLSTQNGHFSSEARVLGALGYAHFLSGHTDIATEMLVRAIQSAPEATPLDDMSLISQWNSMVRESCGDQTGALQSLRVAIGLEQRRHLDQMERWSKVHDMTLGINKALVSVEWIGLKENGWVYTECELIKHAQNIEAMLCDDHLTGVLTKTIALKAMADQEISFAAVFEVQNLDVINQQFDRVVGDEVLRNIASVLEAKFDDTSVIGRYAGNEFIVARNEDDFESAIGAITNFPWKAIHPDLAVKVSFRRVIPDRPHLLAA